MGSSQLGSTVTSLHELKYPNRKIMAQVHRFTLENPVQRLLINMLLQLTNARYILSICSVSQVQSRYIYIPEALQAAPAKV